VDRLVTGLGVRPGAVVAVECRFGGRLRGVIAPKVELVVVGPVAVSARGRGERSETSERDGEVVGPGPACLYPQRCGAGVE
jgi:hypothetical protein